VYPDPDVDRSVGITPVVHDFTKEWIKKGHKVIVINNINKYPFPYYQIPEYIRSKMMSNFSYISEDKEYIKRKFYKYEGVSVYKLPLVKLIPWGIFFPWQINKQYNKIIKILEKENFKPDNIIGHWENPQLPLISLFKRKYQSTTTIVFHGLFYINKRIFGSMFIKQLKDIDSIGFRSENMMKEFTNKVKINKKLFICHSGIPELYLERSTTKLNENNSPVKKYLYVGNLIKRKNVDTIINALEQVSEEKEFILNIVGKGEMYKELENLISNKNLNNNINMLNYLDKENVFTMMKESDCFTMISNNEVFGLVYLEAMATGNIVIASKNSGIDGIIIDGVNGFLCNPGDEKELVDIYRKINKLTEKEKNTIIKNAINTAKTFSQFKMSEKYLENLEIKN
jgi:glycosyltransferase involved in cell wall biosynthesis